MQVTRNFFSMPIFLYNIHLEKPEKRTPVNLLRKIQKFLMGFFFILSSRRIVGLDFVY